MPLHDTERGSPRPRNPDNLYVPKLPFDRRDYVSGFLEQSRSEGLIDDAQTAFLRERLLEPPDAVAARMDPAVLDGFLWETCQLVDACIYHGPIHHHDTINRLVQAAIDEDARFADEGWMLEPITDGRRADSDRETTFGQVHMGGRSSFVGAWRVLCGERCRLASFVIDAEVAPDSIAIEALAGPDAEAIATLVRARGEQPARVQVPEEAAVLGAWITRLAGSPHVGQRAGYASLGVLGEAVSVAMAGLGLSNLLLPRSRRDPETEPWHTGPFLVPVPGRPAFRFKGCALSREEVVAVRAEVVLAARIELVRTLR